MNEILQTTGDLLASRAAEYPDRPALIFYGEQVSYAELFQRVEAAAAGLAGLGVRKGDVVAVLMANSPAFLTAVLGAQRLGAVAAPISCWLQPREVEYVLDDSRAVALLADDEHAELARAAEDKLPRLKAVLIASDHPDQDSFGVLIRKHAGQCPAAEVSAADLATVMYTSGTTGRPKGVMLTHGGILAGAAAKTSLVPLQPGERVLCVLPLFHSGGLNDLAFPALHASAAIVLRKSFSASEFWGCVSEYGINAFYIVPTMWNILLQLPESRTTDCSAVRFALSGAAPIPPTQLQECEQRFGFPILEGYGATESTGGVTANSLEHRKAGSVGRPLDGVEVRILGEDGSALPAGKVGEVAARGDVVMRGYLGAPEATAETIRDGWLLLGDMGYLDEEGFLFIVDRKKDIIIRGGVNIYPAEIERVIAGHLAVDLAAVIAESHEKYGQVAHACVVLRRGQALDADALRAYCVKHLAAYKVPERYTFRERLPTNAVGKVLKKRLVEELAEEASAEAVPVAALFESMPARFLADKAEGLEGSASYRITGGGGGDWTVTIADGRLTLDTFIADSPTVLVVARDSDYFDVATGKIDGVTAIVTGKLSVEGDLTFLGKLREVMAPSEPQD